MGVGEGGAHREGVLAHGIDEPLKHVGTAAAAAAAAAAPRTGPGRSMVRHTRGCWVRQAAEHCSYWVRRDHARERDPSRAQCSARRGQDDARAPAPGRPRLLWAALACSGPPSPAPGRPRLLRAALAVSSYPAAAVPLPAAGAAGIGTRSLSRAGRSGSVHLGRTAGADTASPAADSVPVRTQGGGAPLEVAVEVGVELRQKRRVLR